MQLDPKSAFHDPIDPQLGNRRGYSISEIRKAVPATARALHYYEEKGLISPYRIRDQRCYSPRDFRRIEVIVRARQAGLSVRQIEQVLDAYGPGRSARAQVAKALEFLAARLAHIDAERQKVLEATQALEADMRRFADEGTSRSWGNFAGSASA